MSATNGNGNEGPKTLVVPQQGTVVKQGFGSTEIDQRAETASTALAAQASAAVQARYVMAMRNPRDLMKVRERLLIDCRRPGFADKAIYNKPVGDGIEGPSIRLAEAAARAMTNVFTDVFAIYDDGQKRIVRVSASDLEANITYTKDVTIEKTMERSRLRDGQTAISTRYNSRGQIVHLVGATDDDILNKENALASKAMRTCLLRLVPGDILDEAMDVARATMLKKVTEDPDIEQKHMCDAFRDVGVTIDQLKEYLGHAIETSTAVELTSMKKLYLAIKDGEATWADAMDQRISKHEAAGGGRTFPANAGVAAQTLPKAGSVDDIAARAKATREAAEKEKAKAAAPAATPKPADPADAISPGPKAGAKPGQQPLPTAAKSDTAEDPDAADRRAAAPRDDEAPFWDKKR